MAPTKEEGTIIHQSHYRHNRPGGRSVHGDSDFMHALTTRGCIPSKKATAIKKRHNRDGTPRPFAGLVRAEDPICIMMMAPDPRDTVRLAVRDEYNAIDAELRALESDNWHLDRVLRCHVSEITEKLDRFRPNILHIGSHGGDGILCFETKDGECVYVHKAALARLLATQEGLKLVVLNSCFSDEQAQNMAEAVGNVIGMTGPISDADAIAFSREFYRACGTGMKLGEAVRRARYAVNLTSPGFAVRLFTRTPQIKPLRPRLLSRLLTFLFEWLLRQCRAVLIALVVIGILERIFYPAD